MSEFSCLNWGYNGDLTIMNRNDKNDEWFYHYDQITRVPLSWADECIETAKYIRDNTNLPIEIFVSGGVDSICCCESFRKAGIPFKAMTVNFEHNKHDIVYAKDYCEYFGIEHHVLTIEIDEFFQKHLIEYSDYTQCRHPQMVFQAWAVDQSDGFPVFGLGELFLCTGRSKLTDFKGYPQAPYNEGKVLTFEGEQYQFIEKMLRIRGREGVGKFFIHTPELKVSTLIDSFVMDWVTKAKKKKYQDTDSYYPAIKSNFKNLFCFEHFPQVGIRPAIEYNRFKGSPKVIKRNDYTGFEYISEMHKIYQEVLFKKYSDDYAQFSWVSYVDKLKMLCGDIIPNVVRYIEEETNGF